MITQTTSDSTTTAALLAKPVGYDASTRGGFDARERIHRFAAAVHRAIDSVEQSLDSRSRGVMSSRDKYGEQARQYGDKVRERINAQPLQSAAIAVGAGVVLDKVFTRRKPKVRVVNVPAYTRPTWEASPSPDRSARRWTDTAGSYMQGLRATGQEAAGKAGAAASLGLAGAESTASTLARKVSTVPLQMRLATQRLLARSQEYGSMARSEVQARPLVGAGAMLGAGALLTTLWLQRRRPETGMAYVTVDEKGNGTAWQRDRVDVEPRGMISSRPVTSAVVALGLGAVIGAMLKRQ
ncbi:hypothetical protein EZ313_20545 [Ramlibacter henchirensis]|uniref:DUF3618 domain-containing protein n=1 Tax=Ramlibacter henchirensis TaxID=204072 RepID=A0A4Z0BNG0_9BURK|nr:hypothetical protein [Ramlibacter henchirensis]TFZ00833.1 hypothetical protein EZ313_20545 [Ramlibacter henchirensis]